MPPIGTQIPFGSGAGLSPFGNSAFGLNPGSGGELNPNFPEPTVAPEDMASAANYGDIWKGMIQAMLAGQLSQTIPMGNIATQTRSVVQPSIMRHLQEALARQKAPQPQGLAIPQLQIRGL